MKKKLLATNYSAGGINFISLLLRLVFGILMLVGHGYPKLQKFDTIAPKFINFMGLGSSMSLSLAIFAEFFCSLLLILGLFTRLALIPLLVTALVIVFKANGGDVFGKAESGFLYLSAYFVLFIIGAGKFSVDAMISGK